MDRCNAPTADPWAQVSIMDASHTEVMSWDAGDHWQSLRLNMPATSIRDLVIKDDDKGGLLSLCLGHPSRAPGGHGIQLIADR